MYRQLKSLPLLQLLLGSKPDFAQIASSRIIHHLPQPGPHSQTPSRAGEGVLLSMLSLWEQRMVLLQFEPLFRSLYKIV